MKRMQTKSLPFWKRRWPTTATIQSIKNLRSIGRAPSKTKGFGTVLSTCPGCLDASVIKVSWIFEQQVYDVWPLFKSSALNKLFATQPPIFPVRGKSFENWETTTSPKEFLLFPVEFRSKHQSFPTWHLTAHCIAFTLSWGTFLSCAPSIDPPPFFIVFILLITPLAPHWWPSPKNGTWQQRTKTHHCPTSYAIHGWGEDVVMAQTLCTMLSTIHSMALPPRLWPREELYPWLQIQTHTYEVCRNLDCRHWRQERDGRFMASWKKSTIYCASSLSSSCCFIPGIYMEATNATSLFTRVYLPSINAAAFY